MPWKPQNPGASPVIPLFCKQQVAGFGVQGFVFAWGRGGGLGGVVWLVGGEGGVQEFVLLKHPKP